MNLQLTEGAQCGREQRGHPRRLAGWPGLQATPPKLVCNSVKSNGICVRAAGVGFSASIQVH
jgi:hypothetical protein